MEDSERAAATAREHKISAGLHLNFTTAFSTAGTPAQLNAHQQRLSCYLRRCRFSPVIFHPGLVRSFAYVVASQIDEFSRLYGTIPDRLDGHHHMHLCANVLVQKLLPFGTLVRRNFSFRVGEKSFGNRLYRRSVDSILQRRHDLMDYLFVLSPVEPADRLQRIFSLARHSAVEVETHPVNPEEYRFLTEGEVFRRTRDLPIAPRYTLARRRFRQPA